jgi:adenosine deaminase
MTETAPRPLLELPKAHLHLHLEGAMRPSTLYELCEAQGLSAPTIASSYGTFADFQALYIAARSVIRSVDVLSRLVWEVVEDAVADGAVWIEPAVNLRGHQSLGSDEFVCQALLEAGRQASAATGVGVGWLVSADRTLSPELALEQATVAARFAGNGVVAMGLANDEAAGAPEPFESAFAMARAAGLISAPHAGEHGGPDSILGALNALGADRIEHGVRAIEDADLVRRLADDHICLDVCPTSNVSLSVVPSLTAHPLRDLLAAGVPCSINADDPLLFGVGLLDEYGICRENLGLDDAALASCALSSIEHSGAPAELKVRTRQAIDDWLLS